MIKVVWQNISTLYKNATAYPQKEKNIVETALPLK